MQELLIPTLNFTILVILLGYFLVPIFKKSVADRHENIKKFVGESKAQKIEAERRMKEFESKLNDFEIEAKEVLAKAHQDAEALKKKMIADAHISAERAIREAESQAVAQFSEFKDELRRMTIQKAVAAAETMIRDQLSKDDQKRIIREYVEKVQ